MTKSIQAHLQPHRGLTAWVGPAVLLATLLGTGVHAATGTADTELERQLIEQGWQASPDEAGNTLLHPPARIAPETTDPVPPVAQATPDLQQLLRQRGWVIRESAAGTTLQLLLDPPSTPAAATQESLPTAGSRAQDVYRMLEARGWRVRQDASGNTLLIPTPGAESSQSGDATVAEGQAGDSMADFRDTAEAAGWRIESSADGSLIMYPPGKSADQRDTTATDHGCAGTPTASVAEGSTGLPIRDEASARQLAREWLTERHPTGRIVGRVRQINRIFVVSIVGSTPPYPLRNQLVIRGDSGHIVQIY